jgi:isoquinoline 1-oxidoreductase subunit beta
MTIDLSRRGFLKGTAASAMSVLFIGVNVKGVLAASSTEISLNPFIRIDEDGTVTVLAKHFEMGQGTTTGLTTLVAEELDADWSTIKVDFAPADVKKYGNLAWGGALQGTGGSSAMVSSFEQYRKAGAAAKELLVRAASQKWGVAENQIKVENGIISVGNRKGHFGEFIHSAAQFEASPEPKLKSPDEFKLIGNVKVPRKDNISKTDGSAIFAMDVRVSGMVYAVILRCPKFGGKVTSFDASKAQEIKGFLDAKTLPTGSGVVVYAKNTWVAFQAREALSVQWDFSQAEKRSSEEMYEEHRKALQAPEVQASQISAAEAQQAIAGAAKTIKMEFSFPYLAHAPMETLNCVIERTANGIRIHDGCQIPTLVQGNVSRVLGLKPEQIEIKTVYAGGSFGRRGNGPSDYQTEAAMAFDLLGRNVPVKMVWSREDDIQGGFYRPMALHKATIGLDESGKIIGWDHRIASPSIAKGTPFETGLIQNGVDATTVEGIDPTLYSLPKIALGVTHTTPPKPVLWWRSVGHTHTGFTMESLLDIIAYETKQDPVDLRLSLLDKTNVQQKRLTGVIEAVRDLSGWKKGNKRGFASHFSFNTYVAVVADVTVNDNQVHVDKLYIAVDCGVPINPDVIRAQMEGGAGYSLGAVLRNEITFKDGEVVQENFPDYEPLRIGDMPDVEVTIIKSADAPSGVGEPAVPPTAPAVANAIFAVTGKRITDLPMTRHGFKFV